MTKEDKVLVIQDIKGMLQDAKVVYVANLEGLNAAATSDFRRVPTGESRLPLIDSKRSMDHSLAGDQADNRHAFEKTVPSWKRSVSSVSFVKAPRHR